MEQLRSFVAIELPDEVKLALNRLEDRLKSQKPLQVKWVDPKSIHLTLQFLGNISSGRITEITAALAEAANGFSSFHLEIKGLGVFPNPRRVQVAWVGVSGEVEQLLTLQKRIQSNLSPLGFVPESRPFTPHLTVARVREQASLEERQGFGQLIMGTKFEELYSFTVDSIALMRSQLIRSGAIYTRLNYVRLTT